MPLGLYLSVPFCRTKCSFCNFASDVFSKAVFDRYIDRMCADLVHVENTAQQMGGQFERAVDSIYLGGGTPTVLDVGQLKRLFVTISQNFDIQPGAEVTVECAPGTLTASMLETLVACGVNRVSLGVQSFVDQESRTVGRLHTRAIALDDIARLRAAGISDINVDLIAGLPHQTQESWEFSLAETITAGVPHVSVYMLEVDEDSRLGRELIAGGTKYHAHFVPDDDLTADLYTMACERLEGAGVPQYEISNFARAGLESRHNLKYWTRQPYLGFGVDAHSMLPATVERGATTELPANDREGHDFSRAEDAAHPIPRVSAVRFATPENLESYVAGKQSEPTIIPQQNALEESFFLGLRLNRGVDLSKIVDAFSREAVRQFDSTVTELVQEGLLSREGETIRLTSQGRLLSNEVFAKFLGPEEPAKAMSQRTEAS